jgi:hypothetical protein
LFVVISRTEQIKVEHFKTDKMEKTETQNDLAIKRGALGALVDFQLQFEKALTALKIRQTHLKRNGTNDPETEELLGQSVKFKKEFILRPVADILEKHPAYPWFSSIKGVGHENIAKVVSLIDIERAPTISSLWKYAGYGMTNGIVDRPRKGEKLCFNKTLKTMCYRLGVALLKAHGISKEGTKFGAYYEKVYEEEKRKVEGAGKKIANMADIPEGKEAEYVNSLHVHNKAFRKMIKLFLGCLYLYWRKAEGLAIRNPYAVEKMEHTTVIQPEEMADR